jgi:hypothetical protein
LVLGYAPPRACALINLASLSSKVMIGCCSSR